MTGRESGDWFRRGGSSKFDINVYPRRWATDMWKRSACGVGPVAATRADRHVARRLHADGHLVPARGGHTNRRVAEHVARPKGFECADKCFAEIVVSAE